MDNAKSFDTFEEMLAYMREAETEMNARVTPEQREITYGDYWVRNWNGLLIYGHVTTKEDFAAGEAAFGADSEEIAYEWDMLTNAYKRGYRYGWCYSQAEPAGEPGSTHVATIHRKITKAEFDEAQKLGWPS